MAQILQFAGSDDSFDPETWEILGAAYDLAVQNRGMPHVVREVVAGRIIDAGRNGERNLGKLCRLALRGIVS